MRIVPKGPTHTTQNSIFEISVVLCSITKEIPEMHQLERE